MKVWEKFKGNAPRVCVCVRVTVCVLEVVGDGRGHTVEMGAN